MYLQLPGNCLATAWQLTGNTWTPHLLFKRGGELVEGLLQSEGAERREVPSNVCDPEHGLKVMQDGVRGARVSDLRVVTGRERGENIETIKLHRGFAGIGELGFGLHPTNQNSSDAV